LMLYPDADLAYLHAMTDHKGIIQHGIHSVPNRSLGYTTDDNARALIAAAQHYTCTQDPQSLYLAITYLSYMLYAQNDLGKFRNVLSYEGLFLDAEGTEDCHGRSIWGCGVAAASGLYENVRIVAKRLFDESIVWTDSLESSRSRAYAILGMCSYLRRNPDTLRIRERICRLADSLLDMLHANALQDWHWYESFLTYGNAVLPLSMLAAFETTGRKKYEEAAKATMQFLTDVQMVDGRLEIIGNDGWYWRGKKRAWYDQQSIDAGYTVLLYTEAYRILGEAAYLELARTAFGWFFGNNRSGMWVYDPETKGCYDAVTPSGVNLNQGAESCICLLLAQMAMQEIEARESTLTTIFGGK
jgi:hypothetical protein